MALNEKITVEVDVRGKDNLSPVIDAQKRKAQELAQAGPGGVRVPPARVVPVPFQSEEVREARNKARAEAQGLPYQSDRVARLRDESRAAAQDKTAKESTKAADAEKKLASERQRAAMSAAQLLPGIGQMIGGFAGIRDMASDMTGGGAPGGGATRGARFQRAAIGIGGAALAGAAGGGIGSSMVVGALGGRLGRGATEVAAGAGGALGGAAAGALAGSVIPGIGTAVGAAVGAVGGIFTSLIGGAERARKAAEAAAEAWREMEARIAEGARRRLDMEGRRDAFAAGGEASRGDVEAVLSPFTMDRLTRAPREERTAILRESLERARRLDAMGSTADTRFSVAALETAVARGVDGLTRADTSSVRSGFGDAMSVSDGIFEALAARSPAVEATDRTTEEVRATREAIDAMRAEMRSILTSLVPGV